MPFLLFVILTLSFLFAQAQTPAVVDTFAKINFYQESFDFGEIQETDGAVSFAFQFTNPNAWPIRLVRVQPSCGCTTPTFTTEPILPNETGKIEARFDPTNRPGEFNKSLTVEYSFIDPKKSVADNQDLIGRMEVIMLYIKGVVASKTAE